ncbi:LPS O-antigen chain length determinant protein WzzB [Pseudomonas donghuensis]|uniref:LPS O-antigen chain length determinant protein WzzB n=1 Tax=Pseudomonas donghuensis TaxID=1163398 RepID=UPI00029A866F|nr:Wzz/FepE/Etk N-terminal domain-containing protein [Pseudomonas donghuensis]
MQDGRFENRADADADIDFVELLRLLWAGKFLILLVVLVFGLFGLGYVFITKPVYEAKVSIIPPTQSQIAELNYGRTSESGLDPYSLKSVYDVFLRNLQAEALRREFFNTHYLPSLGAAADEASKDKLYERFGKTLRVVSAGKAEPDRYVFSFQAGSPEEAQQWLTEYVTKAGINARDEVIEDAAREAQVRARNISQQISTLRESGLKMREDLIVRLREALRIARAIGLEKPPLIDGAASAELAASVDGELTYMRGAKALEAEITNLERRGSDDPFINKLRDLQARYEFYAGLEAEPGGVKVYRLDGQIDVPESPVAPKKLLILLGATLLGAILGVFLVLMIALIKRVDPRSPHASGAL